MPNSVKWYGPYIGLRVDVAWLCPMLNDLLIPSDHKGGLIFFTTRTLSVWVKHHRIRIKFRIEINITRWICKEIVSLGDGFSCMNKSESQRILNGNSTNGTAPTWIEWFATHPEREFSSQDSSNTSLLAHTVPQPNYTWACIRLKFGTMWLM